jgi:hypothetical protein
MKLPRLIAIVVGICAVGFGLELAGFAYSPVLGAIATLLSLLFWALASMVVGRQFHRRQALAAGVIGIAVALALCYVNYPYLYWVRVILVREIDPGDFFYFGSYYGLFLQASILLGGIAGFLGARFFGASRADQANDAISRSDG